MPATAKMPVLAFDWHLDGLGVLTDIDGCPNTNEMPIQIGIHPKCRYRHLGSGRHFVTEVTDPGLQDYITSTMSVET